MQAHGERGGLSFDASFLIFGTIVLRKTNFVLQKVNKLFKAFHKI